MGKIVTLGEVVADVYREDAPSAVELPFTARPGGRRRTAAVAAARGSGSSRGLSGGWATTCSGTSSWRR